MDDLRMQAALDKTRGALDNYISGLNNYSSGIRRSVREASGPLQEEVSIRVTSCEVRLSRVTALITEDAEYHLLRAYFHASPSLIAILLAIYGFIKLVVTIVNVINTILEVITGETLAHWLGELIPGFEEAWNDIMNKISEFSAALGWGVDGVLHLMNAMNAGADLWGMVSGKERDVVNVEKYNRTQLLMESFSGALDDWQANPGAQIAKYAEWSSEHLYVYGMGAINKITGNLGAFGQKAEEALTHIGTVSNELLALRNDMPAFIARNIPQALWDAVGWADTMINDRLLPALTNITDRLEELDAVLDSYRQKAEALADKIAHPGDVLAEIDNLPSYARTDQLGKIDSVTSSLMREQTEAFLQPLRGDIWELARIAELLTHAPAPLSFMELELPGRSPGIAAEPRETWFVGDY